VLEKKHGIHQPVFDDECWAIPSAVEKGGKHTPIKRKERPNNRAPFFLCKSHTLPEEQKEDCSENRANLKAETYVPITKPLVGYYFFEGGGASRI